MQTRDKIHSAMAQLNSTFIERQSAVAVIFLAYLTGKNYLFIGDPGTGKTALVNCATMHFDGRLFETECNPYIQPDEIIGGIDFNEFKSKGKVVRVFEGGLGDCDFGFLDETFKAPDGVLNSLLSALNKRKIQNRKIPLHACGGATNWPEIRRKSEKVLALYDRFLLRCPVDDVRSKEHVVAMLEASEKVEDYTPEHVIGRSELDDALKEIQAVKLSDPIRQKLHDVRHLLSDPDKQGNPGRNAVKISSRRLGQLQSVLRAAAWLDGRDEVTIEDFDVLVFGLWENEDDFTKAAGILKSVDQEDFRTVMNLIDRGNSIYDDCKRAGFGASRANKAATEIKQIVLEVKNAMSAPVFTKSSRTKIAKAMGEFKENFRELNRAAREKAK